jgi:hypothetical protein
MPHGPGIVPAGLQSLGETPELAGSGLGEGGGGLSWAQALRLGEGPLE